MTSAQADNLVTLIDLLENEVRDEEYDQGRCWESGPCCALGHMARRMKRSDIARLNLFDEKAFFSNDVRQQVLLPLAFGDITKGRPARLEAIRRLRKILDDDGWEIA